MEICQVSFILGTSKWDVVFSGAWSLWSWGEMDGKATVCAQRGVLTGAGREGKSAPGLPDAVVFASGGDSNT